MQFRSLRKLLVALTLSSVLMGQGTAVLAQRTAKGRNFISVSAAHNFTASNAIGGDILFGGYGELSYWDCGVHGGVVGGSLSTGEDISFAQVYAQGGLQARLLHSRSRAVSLYAGGGAFLGYEFFDIGGDVPESVESGLPDNSFLYGIYPKVDLEVFLSKSVALVLYGKFPINFGSNVCDVLCEAGVGFRFSL